MEGVDHTNYMLLMVRQDDVASMLSKQLLTSNWKRYINNYFIIAILGFVRTVSIDYGFLTYLAIPIYLFGLGLIIYFLFTNPKSRSLHFLILCYILICGTVAGTALVIQCETRYMIYNFPLFYIAILTSLNEILPKLIGNKKGQ